MEEENKKYEFVFGLAITLGTIVIGLASYVFYSENTTRFTQAPRCEYNGWAYADKQTYDSSDGCNVCFCHSGETICTQNECNTPELCDDGTVCPVETPL